jgi:hypothetical protein
MYTSTDPSTGGLQLWHIAYSGGTHVYKLTLPTGYHLLQVGAAVAITSVGSPSKLTYNNIYGWISPPHAVDRSFQHAIVATQHVTDSAGSAQNTGRYLAVTVWAPPSTSFPVLVDPQVTFGYYVYLHFFSGDIDNFWGTFFSYGTGVAFAVMCAPFGIVGAVLCGLAGTYWGNAIGNAFWNAAQTTCQRAGYVPDLLADYGWIAPGPLDVATIFGWGIWFGAIHCGVVIKFDDVFPTPVGIIPNVSDSWGQ